MNTNAWIFELFEGKEMGELLKFVKIVTKQLNVLSYIFYFLGWIRVYVADCSLA